ncbi:hypothetical protein MKEN_00086400 [Mycena kentingensis (nom. inval.)]|nr:hypothetical protein MKEN_00086400 [Mycena kentingensis (nom. inval.)]
MSTRTQPPPSSPFSRISLIGKGKATARPMRSNTQDNDYIPYNGPYEEPPRRVPLDRGRDSWGDNPYDDEVNNVIHDLHSRYVHQDPWSALNDHSNSRPRARTHSGVSGRTVSSGAVDPHRTSVGILRKPSHNPSRPPVPSYINLDTSGGVGESPSPPPARFSRETPAPPRRSSLASIFTFGQSSKRHPPSPAKVALPTSPAATSPLSGSQYAHVFGREPDRPRSQPASIYSVSSDQHSQKGDTYHNYNLGPSSTPAPPPHPYSYGTPQRDIPDPPATAPLLTSPKLKFTAPPSQRFVFPQPDVQPAPEDRVRTLKNSTSTPNLRNSSNRSRKNGPLSPAPNTKLKDRWLSAETWCDAVLLPKPRLKVEDAQQIMRGGSGRIVSPPGSPSTGAFDAPLDPARPAGMPSRVLAHSRSMASLNNSDVSQNKPRSEVSFRNRAPPPVVIAPPLAPNPQSERPPRPKSFAWDDLALPSPVPSLARVLEEGQILEHQRKKWQMQATGSFPKHARPQSFARPRQVFNATQRSSATGQHQLSRSSILAWEPGCHSGAAFPAYPVHKPGWEPRWYMDVWYTNLAVEFALPFQFKAATICYPDGALSPAEEKVNGLESALRNGGTKIIRLADPALLPVDPSGPLSSLPLRGGGISPTPSGTSDAHIGIALSTPPPGDNISVERESLRLPSHPYAQAGGSASSYSYHTPKDSISKSADYAGPHPSIAVTVAEPQDVSMRHRLPPQAKLPPPTTSISHPYASKRDSYLAVTPQARLDSDVPGPSKMWAQLSPGTVNEILPDEILYSPYLPESGLNIAKEAAGRDEVDVYVPNRKRKSTVTILDSFGLGETLAHAMEQEQQKKQRRDSGLGTSEEHMHMADDQEDGQAAAIAAHPYRIQRKAVHYETDELAPQTPKTIRTSHTAESSVLDPTVNEHYHHRLTPPTPPLPSNMHLYVANGQGSSPAANSAASSPPRSPPPIGSVDDLDEFRDLFYKPDLTDEVLSTLSRPNSMRYPASGSWDANSGAPSRTQRGSGLTSLARQLSAEFEELRAIRHHIGSIDTDSSISRFSGFPRDSDMQFIFAESEMGRSMDDRLGISVGERPELSETMSAFHPSTRLPEDVESSRASFIIDGNDDGLESFRVRNVESVSTPPATSGQARVSFAGLIDQDDEAAAAESGDVLGEQPRLPKTHIPVPRASTRSSLQPHSADPTRSSYMTTSTLSRISNLSDFPVPPPQHMTPAHMSLLNGYFGPAESQRASAVDVDEDGTQVVEAPTVTAAQTSPTFTPRMGERF